MKHKLPTALLIAAVASLGAGARTLTPEQALQRAAGTVKTLSADKSLTPGQLVHTTRTADGREAVYVFDAKGSAGANSGGYVLLSADDVARPVLGYSLTGTFDAEALPDNLRWWLDEYARQIAWAQSRGLSATAESTESFGPAIAPLIKTAWDQGEPYNGRCPAISGQRTYTGCVATSMAQVMNYWQYPAKGKGKIEYSDDDGCGKRLSFNFATHPFDWANMLDSYTGDYTEAQGEAVALLMQAAGYSVKMSYGLDSSGALAMNVANALVKYFDYDPGLHYTLRTYYSASQWARMMYDNLLAAGPVIYGGASMLGGGHSFILDGYDGNGYFHFNWGWSEMSDGYYSLDALNPQSLGAGGGAGGGYNFTQDAVLGVKPPTGQPAVSQPLTMTQMGTLVGGIDADNVMSLNLDGQNGAMWVNYQPQTLKLEFGAMVAPAAAPGGDDVKYVVLSETKYQIQPGYGVAPDGLKPQVDLGALALADGDYKVTMVTRLVEDEGAEWTPVLCSYGDANYVIVNRTGNTYTVENKPVNDLQVVSAMWDGSVYYGPLNKVSVTVTNPTDIELSRGFAPMIFTSEGQAAFLGQSVLITLKPGETVTREWMTDLMAMSQSAAYIESATSMVYTWFDETTYNIRQGEFLEQVTVLPQPSLPNLQFTAPLTIAGSREAGTVEIAGAEYPLFEVDDASDLTVTASMRNHGGVMAYNLVACVLDEPDAEGRTAILASGGMPVVLPVFRTVDFVADVKFKAAVAGRAYLLTLAIETQSGYQPITNTYLAFRTPASGGVSDVVTDDADADAPVEYYNLQGVRVTEPTPGIYIRRQGSRVDKIAIK